jgi:hypothetical protein
MSVDLIHLEELAKAATPGPWRVAEDNLTHPGSGCDIDADGGTVASDCCGYQGGITNMEDGEYIAAVSPNVVLELINHIRHLKRELTATDSENRHLANNLDVQRAGRATAEQAVASLVSQLDDANAEIRRLTARKEAA